MFDVAIVNGTLVDGTGEPAHAADIALRNGRVLAVAPPGSLAAAASIIDAAGCVVTPGFVDPHTHLDAQLFWDPSGAPSVLHGVTTVTLGSCGFGVAPVPPGMEEYILRSLESVEEIPYESTRQALPMDWRSWPDYFDAVGRLPLGVNVGSFVPHAALRVGVLGPRARERDVSDDDLARLVEATRAALGAGALGVSSSRGTNHTDAVGAPIASRLASDRELEALVAECRGRAWQINLASKGVTSPEGLAACMAEIELYAGWAQRWGAGLTWTPLVVAPGDTTAWRALLDHSARLDLVLPQVAAQPISSSIRFDGPSYAAMVDGWSESFAGYGSLNDRDRARRLADASVRATLKAVEEDCSRLTSACYDRWTVRFSPSSADAVGQSLRALGEQQDQHPIDVLFDLALADGLATVVEAPLSNHDEEAVMELVANARTLIGIGDAGAHVNSITNYSYPTHVLTHVARDRGKLDLAEAVRKLSSQPADFLGYRDRGRVVEGAAADLCVIDLENLRVSPAEVVADLPGGSRRLHCSATGFRAVLVNGVPVVLDDRQTGAVAGELVRVGV